MAELISPGTAASAAWADFTVDAGTPVSLSIKPADSASIQQMPSNTVFVLAHKTPDGKYVPLIELTSVNIVEKGCVYGPGTYGVKRLACDVSTGMDYD